MWSTILPSIVGLLGVVAGALMLRGNERSRQRLDFIEKQLRELYSPLHSLHQEIRTLSETRVRIQHASEAAWREICQNTPRPDFEPFSKITEYDNDQFKSMLLPAYEKMLLTLREKFYLAEESTRGHLPTLIEYLEIWRRDQSRSLPGEVIRKLGHSEERLEAFYDDLEETFIRLRGLLRSGGSRTWFRTNW